MSALFRFVCLPLHFFFFEDHVAVLDRVEYFAALLALDKFGVFVARNNTDLRMPALRGDGFERRNGKIFTRLGCRVNALLDEISGILISWQLCLAAITRQAQSDNQLRGEFYALTL